MGPYRYDDRLSLPSKDDVREWLRHHVTKPPPSRWRRWLGEPAGFRYEIDAPAPWPGDLFRVHRLFTVRAREPGLLPLPCWQDRRAESWGLFATGPDGLELLLPREGSLTRLLRAEGCSLDDVHPPHLAELVCALELGDGLADVHTVAPPGLARKCESPLASWYEVDGERLTALWPFAEPAPPSIEPVLGGGWEVRFSTLVRRKNKPVALGMERLMVSPDFALHHQDRWEIAREEVWAVFANPGPVDEPE